MTSSTIKNQLKRSKRHIAETDDSVHTKLSNNDAGVYHIRHLGLVQTY